MFSMRFEGKNLIAADIFFASLEVVFNVKVFILAFLFSIMRNLFKSSVLYQPRKLFYF